MKNGKLTSTNNLFTIPCNKNFKQVIITPKHFGFIIDVQYEVTTAPKSKAKGVSCHEMNGTINVAKKICKKT